MAFSKPTLVTLQLLVICFTVLGNEFELQNLLNSAPSYPVADSPTPHHHFHSKIAQAPVKSQPPTQTPVKPFPPSKSPVKPLPPTKSPVKPLPPTKSPVKPLPPIKTPVKPLPPSKAPVKPLPPTKAPVKPIPRRSFVAVQGVVYCKDCKFSGVDTLLGAIPLAGANVELHCNNTKVPKVQLAKTDKNGYFFMIAQNSLTTFGAHKCKVTLGSSNNPKCKKPTNLHYGLQGSILMPQKQPNLPKPLPYQLYTVGPFAYEAATICVT